MKNEKLYEAIGQIDDELIDKANKYKKENKYIYIKWGLVAVSLCIVLLIGFNTIPQYFTNKQISDNANYLESNRGETEDMLAPNLTIYFDSKEYVPISDDLIIRYGFEKDIQQSQIGERIGATNDGKEVYSYKPVGCDAVIVVKSRSEFKLYSFISFDSYTNNQDEDMIEYLKLYGINSYSDIKKVIIAGKELEENEIEIFYNLFSYLKNSSDEYFESLDNYRGTNLKESTLDNDYKRNMPTVDDSGVFSNEGDITDESDCSTHSNPGTSALNNAYTITVYSNNGLFFEMQYYSNINFISRQKVSSEFEEFLKSYL